MNSNAPTLYDRLGGVYAIATVVDDFIDRVMSNPILNANPAVDEAHHRVSPAGFKYLVTEMVCWASGGPQQYSGRAMRESHEQLKITEAEWAAFCKDFDDTMAKFGVPDAERNELFAIVQSTVTSSSADNVLVPRPYQEISSSSRCSGEPSSENAQTPKRKEPFMYKNILVAIDGQELSNKALTQAIGLAKALGAKMTVLNVTPRWSAGASGGDVAVMYPAEAHEANIADAAKQLLSKSAAIAQSAGVLCDTAHANDAYPYKAILDTASAKGCDLIVMGSHGRRGIAGLLLGSETQKTLTHGKIPVLVYRE